MVEENSLISDKKGYSMVYELTASTVFFSANILDNVKGFAKNEFTPYQYSQSQYSKTIVYSTVLHPTFPSCVALIVLANVSAYDME